MPPPKALLFDIGGVVVVSPFQAILDYEIANSIPTGYINFSISRSPRSGAWQRIERGECELNDAWFEAFKAQLQVSELWAEYWTKHSAQTSSRNGAVPAAAVEQTPPVPNIDAKKLFWNMMRISRTPDRWMYPALKRLRESGKFVLGALSNTVVFPAGIRDEDGVLFKKELVHPPAPSPHADDSTKIQDAFDVFISSAHVGLRKPDPKIYEMAVKAMSEISRKNGGSEIGMGDVVFLDDIGANLKGAKECGLGTIKVDLGRSWKAVRELEKVTGLKLMDEEPEKARL